MRKPPFSDGINPHFDREFNDWRERSGRRFRRTRNAVLVVGVFTALLSFGILGWALYVAHHFIAKNW